MKKIIKNRRIGVVIASVIFLLFSCILFPMNLGNDGGRYAITAKAYDTPSIEIQRYDVDMSVQTDYKISVEERITVRFLKSGLSMFYRSLPKKGARYSQITASCNENEAFYYEVADNPDLDEFFDINCIGGAQKGNVWTYTITYTMQPNNQNAGDTLRMDVIGFGWPVELNNVTANIDFPAPISEDFGVWNRYNATEQAPENEIERTLSEDKKSLTLKAEKLELYYISQYGEEMAKGMTLEFSLPNGTMQNYAENNLFTANFWTVLWVGVICVGVSFFVLFTFRKKHEMITVVNVKAPDDMDPMKMGKWIDGAVDSEDVTSMIYYFAHKGYLLINWEDQDDPILIKKVAKLPDDAPIYQKTLFNGLFKSGESVSTSDLSEKFYEDVAKAQLQMPSPKMYEKKSVLGFFLGGLIGGTLGAILPAIFSQSIGGGYTYFAGFIFFLPIVVLWFVAYLRENYRYKWKSNVKNGLVFIFAVLLIVVIWLFVAFFAKHFMTEAETLLLSICVFACTVATLPTLSRRAEYVAQLGKIIGFKDFILYTEEDKIKVMLEENPELYYKVLPYAQVLGVTNEWENKFVNILLEPPTWCVGSSSTVFDYVVFHHCMRTAFSTAMQPPQSSTGRAGGGGSFGGFGGGGFGGGGGGAR